MTRITRKEKAELIAQERAIFAGMKITVRPDVDRCEKIEQELNAMRACLDCGQPTFDNYFFCDTCL